jgi:hypothetical protein
MRRLSASLLFLIAGTVTFAQTPGNPPAGPSSSPAPTTFTVQPRSSDACPVGFFASRQTDAAQFTTAKDAPPSGSAQGLHLTLQQRQTRSIQSVEVTVYATSLKPRTLPLNMRSDDFVSNVSKTFTFERQPDSTSLTEADAWMQQVGSVRWADLISVAYTDGTTWHAADNLKCRAVPSNLLLVGSK